MKIKYLLRELLFKDEIEQTTRELINLKGQVNKLQTIQFQTEKMLTHIMSNEHNQIIHYATNKMGDQIFVVKHGYDNSSKDFELYLYCVNYSYRDCHILPHVYCRVCSNRPDYYQSQTINLVIDDIWTEPYTNIGNGRIAIEAVKRVANQISAKRINGILSPVDKNHFDLLEAFYSSCGFVVSFNKSKTSGHIELIL